MGSTTLTLVITATVIACVAVGALIASLVILAKGRRLRRESESRNENQPQYRHNGGAIIAEEPKSRRAATIAEQVNLLVRQASEPGSRVRAVVSSPPGLGRNASLTKSLMQYAPGRGVTVPAEGLRDEHSVLSWLSAHASELSSADVILVDGMLTRGPGEGSVSETLVRLLSGRAVQVQRKYAASFELRLKERFSLVLSEPDRNAQWASSVIAALTPEGSPTKELWL